MLCYLKWIFGLFVWIVFILCLCLLVCLFVCLLVLDLFLIKNKTIVYFFAFWIRIRLKRVHQNLLMNTPKLTFLEFLFFFILTDSLGARLETVCFLDINISTYNVINYIWLRCRVIQCKACCMKYVMMIDLAIWFTKFTSYMKDGSISEQRCQK